MPKATKQSAQSGETETARSRPVASFKLSGVELTVWKNPAPIGDVYNTTIRNSYKDEKADEWKGDREFQSVRSCHPRPALRSGLSGNRAAQETKSEKARRCRAAVTGLFSE